MDNKSEIQALEQNVATNIKWMLKQNQVTQEQLVKLCQKRGFSVSQSTLSRMLSNERRMNIYYLNAICKALGVSIDEMINGRGSVFASDFFSMLEKNAVGEKFSINPNKALEAFQGYMGDYYVYFRSTVSYERGKIIKGRLSLTSKKHENYCWAGLKLNTGVVNNKNEPIFKYYKGEFIISNTVGTGYIFLVNEEAGEISVIAVRHRLFRTEPLKCRLAAVLTVCAGDEKVPTLHRMLLSREKVPDDELHKLLPYLDFGDSKLIVLKEEFDTVLEECHIDAELGERLLLYAEEDRYACFDDNILKVIKEKSVNRFDYDKFIARLRRHNSLPIRNDRISSSIDLEVYEMISMIDGKEKYCGKDVGAGETR